MNKEWNTGLAWAPLGLCPAASDWPAAAAAVSGASSGSVEVRVRKSQGRIYLVSDICGLIILQASYKAHWYKASDFRIIRFKINFLHRTLNGLEHLKHA